MTTEETTNKPTFPRRKRRRRRRRKVFRGDRRSKDKTTSVQSPETLRAYICPPPNYPLPKVQSTTTRNRNPDNKSNESLNDYISKLPEQLIKNLYSGMGGQPSRISSNGRLIQLTIRALKQESRLTSLLKGLHQRDKQALIILLQCGGIAHKKEFIDELNLSLGGNESEWNRSMKQLSLKGLVAISETKGDNFFYLIPHFLVGPLADSLKKELKLPTFNHEEMRIIDQRSFTPPFDFSLMTLATYIDQHPPRLT